MPGGGKLGRRLHNNGRRTFFDSNLLQCTATAAQGMCYCRPGHGYCHSRHGCCIMRSRFKYEVGSPYLAQWPSCPPPQLLQPVPPYPRPGTAATAGAGPARYRRYNRCPQYRPVPPLRPVQLMLPLLLVLAVSKKDEIEKSGRLSTPTKRGCGKNEGTEFSSEFTRALNLVGCWK